MMFLMYALTAAYISGAGELIASSVNDWFGSDITPATGAIFFALIGGGVVCVGTSLVDLFNRFLFSAKILFLIIMLVLLAPHVHKVNLLTLPLEKGLALSAIPPPAASSARVSRGRRKTAAVRCVWLRGGDYFGASVDCSRDAAGSGITKV
ncbi:hypothetical protein L1887_46191 [Cichorium endivia]|nr:hypothetical protein L1887_46191 [Cichorium endivia]